MIRQLTLSVLLVFCTPLISFSQGSVTNQRLFDTIPFLPEHYRQMVEQFNKEPVETGNIIFLGNSITEMGNWKKLLDDNTVINRGISGDITIGVLGRLEDIVRRKPSRLFLMIGVNDIGKDIPDEVIADNIRKIVLRIKTGSPATKIFIQSILPVNPTIHNFPQHYDKEQHIIHTNKLITLVARETGCPFINLFPVFLDGKNRMNQNYTLEGLHLNQEGYTVWVNYLKKNGYL